MAKGIEKGSIPIHVSECLNMDVCCLMYVVLFTITGVVVQINSFPYSQIGEEM